MKMSKRSSSLLLFSRPCQLGALERGLVRQLSLFDATQGAAARALEHQFGLKGRNGKENLASSARDKAAAQKPQKQQQQQQQQSNGRQSRLQMRTMVTKMMMTMAKKQVSRVQQYSSSLQQCRSLQHGHLWQQGGNSWQQGGHSKLASDAAHLPWWLLILAAFGVPSPSLCHASGSDTAKATEATAGSSSDERQPQQAAPQGLESNQVVANEHTAKWRVFTDLGRDMFSQGRMQEAERYFRKALQEARLGFGSEDPHVASSLNNLAELLRVTRRLEEAEPMYVEAIERLRRSSRQGGRGREEGGREVEERGLDEVDGRRGGKKGSEHVRLAEEAKVEEGVDSNLLALGLALHNLGGVYLLQGKLQDARRSYEEALEAKVMAVGEKHPEVASTKFHLGEVFRVLGDAEEAEPLIKSSIEILEEIGAGYSAAAVRRMGRLAEMLLHKGRLEEAERSFRRILHVVETSEGSSSLNLAAALENVALVLLGKLKRGVDGGEGGGVGSLMSTSEAEQRSWAEEAKEMLQKSLQIRQAATSQSSFQVASTLLNLSTLYILQLEKSVGSKAPEMKDASLEAKGKQNLELSEKLEDTKVALLRCIRTGERELAALGFSTLVQTAGGGDSSNTNEGVNEQLKTNQKEGRQDGSHVMRTKLEAICLSRLLLLSRSLLAAARLHLVEVRLQTEDLNASMHDHEIEAVKSLSRLLRLLIHPQLPPLVTSDYQIVAVRQEAEQVLDNLILRMQSKDGYVNANVEEAKCILKQSRVTLL